MGLKRLKPFRMAKESPYNMIENEMEVAKDGGETFLTQLNNATKHQIHTCFINSKKIIGLSLPPT